MRSPEPPVSQIPASPLQGFPRPLALPPHPTLKHTTYVGVSRSSESTHTYGISSRSDEPITPSSWSFFFFSFSWSPLRSAHQNGAGSLAWCDTAKFAWDSTHPRRGTNTRDMVVSEADTILLPRAVTVTKSHPQGTRKKRRPLSLHTRQLTCCMR